MTQRIEIKFYETVVSKYFNAFFHLIALCAAVIAPLKVFIDSRHLIFFCFTGLSIILLLRIVFITRDIFDRKPFVTFNPLGITNQFGDHLDWGQIRKAYIWTGVLFVWGSSKASWFLRIEQYEIGKKQFALACKLIKESAPPQAKIEL